MPPRFTREDFLEAIPGSMGLITYIANKVGCNWHTAKKWIYRDSEILARYEDELESTKDYVETKLLEQIDKGDPGMIKFYLSTKAGDRGFVKKTITGHYDLRQIDLTKLSDQQLARLTSGESPDFVIEEDDDE